MKTFRLTAIAGLVLLVALGNSRESKAEFVTDTTPVPASGEPGAPTDLLSAAELQTWIAGRRVFDRDWTQEQGLGTDINGDSCRSCHEDPGLGGAGGLDLNVFRYGFDDNGSGPFSDLPGGQVASKIRAPNVPGRDEVDPAADVFEQRQTPSAFGLGLLDGVPDAEIIANADPMDLDGDGIFGVVRMHDVGGGVMEVGRLGWKCQIPKSSDFVRDALGGELGITVPDNGRGFGMLSDTDGVADPEITNEDIDALTFFVGNLQAPPRKGSTNPLVAQGEQIFETVGCAKCHVPTLNGASGPVSAYTNLLLHNVHPPDFRGMADPDPVAGVGMFRTSPLWGISGTAPYMHDGSAESLLDAIQAHAGEASGVTANFNALSGGEREALMFFLEDL